MRDDLPHRCLEGELKYVSAVIRLFYVHSVK